MSLKQECIDIINLITEPLKKDEYDLYEIETDSIRDICELSGKDVTYGNCQKLRQEYSFFENIDTDILPIVFHTDFAKDNKGKTDYETKGNFVSRGKQNVINTYYCMEDIERTKQNIRHELLHYFLYMSDMKYTDDNAIFHYLCGIYDAHAYMEMGDEEQGLYDKLIFVIPELEKKCKELNCKDGAFNANRDVVLMVVGNDREDFSNKELFDYGMKLLNMTVKEKE